MITVPQLGCNEKVFPLHTALLELLLKTFPYALFIAICSSSINMLQLPNF